MNRLKNCKVYLGPVTGSILIEDVEGCIFVLASHQIRIHLAKRCDFYLRVRSRPIIEDSIAVRFAPYCLDYEGIEMDLEKAGLSEETGNWENVDDFKWLRAVQSPNWCILPENERVGKAESRIKLLEYLKMMSQGHFIVPYIVHWGRNTNIISKLVSRLNFFRACYPYRSVA
ncbi:Tubulin-folding cofactor C [Hibiscus syriacus]|uniref:Tubulin-folding cofactor C n=1 Tax=Hibiscus syriacus TaxID=106335 RepID=A0A6A3ABQ4_HIBSY|nr:Tubulin-folding cofactor C [Hibiscus syriacus]